MATVTPKNRSHPRAKSVKSDVPLLYAGDHLSQPEFHRRYEAYPKPDVKFELIGGIVYMMTPAGYDHGRGDYRLCGITFQYEMATLGVEGAHNPTVVLSPTSEPQPDIVLMVRHEYGGRTRVRGKPISYIFGPPELIIEVAHSSIAIDLHQKRSDYRDAGVLEYIVLDIEGETVRWFDLARDVPLTVSPDNILRSRVFPGYWLDTQALLAEDIRRLAVCMSQGIASNEHKAFVELLAKHRESLPKVAKSTIKGRQKPKKKKGK